MTINLIPLEYNGASLRMVGTIENPEWVAADVVAILYPEADSRNYSNYLSKVPDEWKGHKKITTLGGDQEMTTVFESGLYRLIARSNSPIAVHFQKWLFEEVLPSIRRTGGYSVNRKPDRFAEIREQVEIARTLAGDRGNAVTAYKILFGSTPKQSANAAPEAASSQEKTIPPAEIINDFLAKLAALHERGIVGDWNVTIVKYRLKRHLAVRLIEVLPLIEEHFNSSHDRAVLESAILACDGLTSSNQKFHPKSGGAKKTIAKRCVLIPFTPIDPTSAARTLLESTIRLDSWNPSGVTQNRVERP